MASTTSQNPKAWGGLQRMGGWGKGVAKSYLASRPHRTGMNWTRDFWGFGKRGPGVMGAIGKWGGPAYLAATTLHALSTEGVGAAAMNLVEETAWTYGLGVGMKALGIGAGYLAGGALAVGGAAAAIGYSMGYRPSDMFRPWVNDYMKRHARLELATPDLDVFGNIATMRQRSVQAINNSRLNGRSALGHEGMLTYTPYTR